MKTLEELCNTSNLLIARIGIDGGCGEIFKLGKRFASVIWSYGCGWEHVSICPYRHSYTPSWDEMCELKDMFFHDEETVVQYHPAKSEYVNERPNCLHLWRPIKEELPIPPTVMVGRKPGQSREEFWREAEELERRTAEEL